MCEGINGILNFQRAFLVVQQLRIHLLMQETQETWIQSLGREDPLEEEMATHSQCSCLENPLDRGAWRARVYRIEKSWTQLQQP